MKTVKRGTGATVMAFILSYALIPAASTRANERLEVPATTSFVLPSGRAGSGYNYQFSSEGGLAPLTWSQLKSS
jgi:hypothetical protein